jgi:AraC family transcriptional regulator
VEKHCLQHGLATLVEKYNPVCWQWRADKIEQSGETINLILSDDLVSGVCESALGIDQRKILISSIGSFQDEFMLQMALELRGEAEQKSPFGKLFGETAAQLLAIHLLRKYTTIQPKLPNLSGRFTEKSTENSR